MKATKLVYWPGSPTLACDEHAERLVNLAAVLFTPLRVVATLSDAECANCIVEAKLPNEGALAKVESGGALPPLDKEWEVEVQVLMRDGRDDMARTRAVLHCRERQLKASMLREKGKDEEIERLKGLLKFLQTQGKQDEDGDMHWSFFLSKHHRDMESALQSWKDNEERGGDRAAVTGEQP